MTNMDLVDSIVSEEYREFEKDPLGYTADRNETVGGLTDEGIEEEEAHEAWRKFERKYLVTDRGGVTFSAHGIDRARNLGEDIYVDEEVHSELLDTLRKSDGRSGIEELVNSTGFDRKTVEHNLWILRLRGLVETRTDGYSKERSVVLSSPDGADS